MVTLLNPPMNWDFADGKAELYRRDRTRGCVSAHGGLSQVIAKGNAQHSFSSISNLSIHVVHLSHPSAAACV